MSTCVILQQKANTVQEGLWYNFTLFSNRLWRKSYLKELYFHQNVLKFYRTKVKGFIFLCLCWDIQLALFAQHIEHYFYLSSEWLLYWHELKAPSSLVNSRHTQQKFLWTVLQNDLSVLLQLKTVAVCVYVYRLSHHYWTSVMMTWACTALRVAVSLMPLQRNTLCVIIWDKIQSCTDATWWELLGSSS